ncbi:hypothetical protein ACSAZL_10865 [Methanosarcina sp. T3]
MSEAKRAAYCRAATLLKQTTDPEAQFGLQSRNSAGIGTVRYGK